MKADAVRRLVFQIWLFLLVALAGTTLLWTQPVLRLAAVAAFAMPVLAWVVLRLRRPLELLDVAILVAIAAHLVVSLASLDREASLESTAIVVVYAAAYFAARQVVAHPDLRRVTAITVVVALSAWLALISATWVAEKVADVRTFGWPPRLDAYQAYVWGSVNTPPALVLLASPFVAWLPNATARRSLAALLAVVAVVVIPFSVGRAAWLGIVVGLLSLEPLHGYPVLRRVKSKLRWTRTATVAVLTAVVATSIAASMVIRPADAAAALDSRVRLWQQAASLFASDPLTGSGPGTFSWARLVHVPDFTDRVGASAAHNVPMQTLAEGGLLLGVALAFVVAAWICQVAPVRHMVDAPRRWTVAALVGFGAFSLLDDLSFLPAVTVVVIILAAWSLPAPDLVGERRAGRRELWWLLVPGVLAAAAIVTAPAAVSLGVMRVGLADARAAAIAGDWEPALTGFRAAAAAQPSSALHWMSVGLAEAQLGRTGAAIDAYQAARQANPGDPRPGGALAALDDEDRDKADLLHEAARRSNDPQYAYRLASALVAEDREAEAAESFATASVLQPRLLGAMPDSLMALVRAELPAAMSRVGSVEGRNPEEVAWNAALGADEIHPTAPIQWHVARYVDAGDESTADAALDDATASEPRSVRTWEAASAVAALRCDGRTRQLAESRIDLLGREIIGESPITERRPGIYREPDLGDYQPPSADALPPLPQWPLGFIDVPRCG